MNAHALEALEFDRIRELLARRAASAPGRERALACGPGADLDAVRLTLEAVRETVRLQIEAPDWGEIAAPDIRPVLARAAVAGGVLEAADFLAIGGVLEIAARLPRFFGDGSPSTGRAHLATVAGRLLVEQEFPRRISRTFEPSGEIRDDASPGLRSVRRELQRVRHGASTRLESLSQQFRGSGEDSFVTLRGGRYVLSVAAAEKRHVQGIVHDRSATGKTLYVEPLELVEVNNTLAELEADERAEIHRILRELTGWVRARSAELAETVTALAELDELNARGRLARDLAATLPFLDENAQTLRVVSGRHPLLYLAVGTRTVPLDLTLEGELRALVISGPNMGGKTVVLKTVGLLVLMALSGLFVPAADGTTLPWADEIYVDIGDEQSLESDLSTYAARLRNMRAALAGAAARSVVLLDELGAGTDPAEGAALGRALLTEVARRQAFCVATTHLGAFKLFAAQTPGFDNGAMEYDPETLRPTYRLVAGLPGRSHAFELARREGWPAETLARAAGYLPAAEAQADQLLSQIEAELRALRDERAQTTTERERLAADRQEYRRLAAALKEKQAALRLERVLAEDRRLRELHGLLAEVRERLERSAAGEAESDPAELRRWFHERERKVAEIEKTRPPVPRVSAAPAGGPLPPEEIAPGRRVFAASLGVAVTIVEGSAGSRRVAVEHRGVRVTLAASDLRRLPESSARAANGSGGRESVSAMRPRPSIPYVDLQAEVAEGLRGEIDLRGLSREDCLARLDLYLDRAVLAGYPLVRIIHGKGTGILHREVQAFLKSHRHVLGFRTGEAHEGGWGVTVATLSEAGNRPSDGRGAAGVEGHS